MDDIARLESIHNTVAPVNRLPPELLAIVYAYATAGEETYAQLVRITHVCQLWRTTALDAASLWTRIAVNDPEGIETFLKRAKNLPVSLSVTICKPPVVSTVRLITSEIHRVRSLKVRVPADIALDVVTNRLKVAAPLLEEFCIEKLESKWVRRPTPATEPERSVPLLGMPSLRSLSLSSVPLLYIPQGPNLLTELTLHRKLPTPDILLRLLKSSPCLKTLCMRGTFEYERILVREEIELPKLEALHLSTFPPQGIANLLASIVLPKNAKVAIQAPLDIIHEFEDIFVNPLPPIPPTVGLACFQGLRRLELCWDDEELDLRAYHGADDFTDPALHIEASHIGPYPGNRFLANWAFDTSQVETLVLCGNAWRERGADRPVARAWWAPMFDALPALRTVRVMCIGEKTLDEFIASFLVGPNPQLETIELVDVRPSPVFWARLRLMITVRGAGRPGGSVKRVELFDVGKGPGWTLDDIEIIMTDQGVEFVWDVE
ncbi:hypothetical protein PYCCODRAFT_1376848 [Trametes coccinea BRFM310]|uniref:Uncharacterized protein n=1 Tax=Trametes coccinea (strain BRFM310) TaxID=1353009 RepID=A0A1Y2IB45_TRAC3|nr:hypothetical protein PYCCODRAFT_1376848 [Trametes coccinea BRFM310]